MPKRVAKFRQLAAEHDRHDVPITIVTWGDPSLDTLLSYRDLGVDRVVVGAARDGLADPATTFPFIDRYAELLGKLA